MDYARYVDVYYFALTLLYALVVIGRQRIKELMSVSLISIIVVGIINVMGINLGLFRYNKPFLDVFGIPLFHLLWTGVAGIVLIEYMKPRFSHNLLMLVYATAIVEVLAFISELAGAFERIGSYNYYYDFMITFASLTTILLLSESLYKYKIYNKI
ncbi:MAG TPA: hypothetical protein VEB00_06300 [Clostridia bacterium]|nr:hypothetical protein [Clostridia bacterium]